jgi:uncharacterized protein (TIGR03086 family)
MTTSTTNHDGAPPGPMTLLEHAVAYLLDVLPAVRPDDLPLPTRCPGWDLADLLAHLEDSLHAFHEAAWSGRVEPPPSLMAGDEGAPADCPVGRVILGARALAQTVSWADVEDVIDVGGHPLPLGVVAAIASLEIAVHGWDVAQVARGPSLPAALAEGLLPWVTLLVGDADRGIRFAPPLVVPPSTPPQGRLLAFLGRDPTSCHRPVPSAGGSGPVDELAPAPAARGR